jgi:cellulose synthase/poly-beta-1,6-N-acetylglucosamine synthase-like glycosyltransferase
MTKGFYIAILVVYTLCLGLIAIYALIQLHLAWKYHRKKDEDFPKPKNPTDWPKVTVQLPIYNERYVVERLIDSVASLNYPAEKLEIQVLDDSTDDSIDLAASKVTFYRRKGIDIKHIRRPERTGFKAGALQYGLECAKGEFIAIFDADFVPKPDFIKSLIPYFDRDKVGLVQARWGHMNEDYSILTRVQAFHLNHHFTTEQQGRNLGGYFMNFNGTGGMWRKSTIVNAGGWEANTLTEDLDLSYRAQLKGWDFRFVETTEAPAELPMVMSAVRSQQYRWMKGSAEVARKHLWGILKSRDVSLSQKLHSIGHLLGSSVFILVLILAIFSLPMIWMRQMNMGWFPDWYLPVNAILKYSFLGFLLAHLGTVKMKPKGLWRRTKYFVTTFPPFLCLSTGMAFHNGKAVFQGFLGMRTDFIRTPKFNIGGVKGNWRGNVYLKRFLDLDSIIEICLLGYFLISTGLCLYWGFFDLLPFLLLVSSGFGLIVYFSIYHHWLNLKNKS